MVTVQQPYKKKVLLLHCEYLQKAGEDKVVTEEGALLEKHYHVLRFIRSNEELLLCSHFKQLLKMVWNRKLCGELRQFLQQHEPDIIHVHNTFPLLSPAVFQTLGRWKRQCQRQGKLVRIVLTLHNFRLHCPQASLMRPLRLEGGSGSKLCQRCFSAGNFRPALRSRCYRGSLARTWAIALMLTLHKKLGTWRNNVDKFIYLNTAQRVLLTRVGLPDKKFTYKPNFLAADWISWPPPEIGKSFRLLFVGRLSEEKGLRILLDTIWNLRHSCDIGRNIELRIAGDGPLQQELEDFVATFSQEDKMPGGYTLLEYLGCLGPTALHKAMRESHFLVLPSLWYEGMPMTLLESLAVGRPTISFRLGAYREILEHQVNGILVPFFSDPLAEQELYLQQAYPYQSQILLLSSAIKEACAMDQKRYNQMCRAARASFEQNYTAKRNLEMLRLIYEN